MKPNEGGIIPSEASIVGSFGCFYETHRMPESTPKIKVRIKKVDLTDPVVREKFLKSLEQLQKSLDADEIAQRENGHVLDMRLD